MCSGAFSARFAHRKERLTGWKCVLSSQQGLYRYLRHLTNRPDAAEDLAVPHPNDNDSPDKEISDILRVPMGTVGTLIARGKNMFRAICQRKGGGLLP